MRASYVIIAVVAIAILGFLGYGYYDYNVAREGLKNIYVGIASALPRNISQDSITLRVGVRLYNNGSSTVAIDRVIYELYISDTKLGSGSYSGHIEIPARGSVTLDTDFMISRSALGEIFYKIITGSGLSIKLKIYIYRNTLLGAVEEIRETSFKI
ncbi:MAG: LEA type 2 family protein [Sulfolobales archaeon]